MHQGTLKRGTSYFNLFTMIPLQLGLKIMLGRRQWAWFSNLLPPFLLPTVKYTSFLFVTKDHNHKEKQICRLCIAVSQWKSLSACKSKHSYFLEEIVIIKKIECYGSNVLFVCRMLPCLSIAVSSAHIWNCIIQLQLSNTLWVQSEIPDA